MSENVNEETPAKYSKLDPYHNPNLLYKKLTKKGRAPERKTNDAAGYDLCSAEDVTILAGHSSLIKTDIAIQCPVGTYGRLASRSGLALCGLDVAAGVIDRDYTGNVKILIRNNSKETAKILVYQRIAQLILEKITTPDVEEVLTLDFETSGRMNAGFGSTGK